MEARTIPGKPGSPEPSRRESDNDPRSTNPLSVSRHLRPTDRHQSDFSVAVRCGARLPFWQSRTESSRLNSDHTRWAAIDRRQAGARAALRTARSRQAGTEWLGVGQSSEVPPSPHTRQAWERVQPKTRPSPYHPVVVRPGEPRPRTTTILLRRIFPRNATFHLAASCKRSRASGKS